MSSELESLAGEPRPDGLLGHTIIRVYGAVVPGVQDYDVEHAGWGTGFAISYGVARAVQVSLELAYYRFETVPAASIPESSTNSDRNAIRQATMSVGLQSPARSWLRPWFGLGFGAYEVTETQEGYAYYPTYPYRYVTSGTQLGINWGLGVSARLDQQLAIDVGGRYHHGFGRPFLETPNYWRDVRLFSVQAGLSYMIH
jgi:opacity protein-like surface antigen